MEHESKPTNGSLFAGIAGIDIGFEAEGFSTEWFIESDSYCQTILKKNFPNASIYGDIKEVPSGSLCRVNVLHGGFPCQDISNAGKRAGIEGSRSSLWKYFKEKIRVLRPEVVLIENVSALANRGLNVVLADLAEIGYDAEWHCISASSVGAPHQRERIFILGHPCNNGQSSTKERSSVDEGSNRTEKGEKQTCESEGPSEQHKDVAYSNSSSAEYPLPTGRDLSTNCCSEISNSMCSELEGLRKGGDCESRLCKEKEEPLRRVTNWSTEPEMGRVAHGIPNRVDRIKCLGNAVVPQCARVFARAIKRIDYND